MYFHSLSTPEELAGTESRRAIEVGCWIHSNDLLGSVRELSIPMIFRSTSEETSGMPKSNPRLLDAAGCGSLQQIQWLELPRRTRGRNAGRADKGSAETAMVAASVAGFGSLGRFPASESFGCLTPSESFGHLASSEFPGRAPAAEALRACKALRLMSGKAGGKLPRTGLAEAARLAESAPGLRRVAAVGGRGVRIRKIRPRRVSSRCEIFLVKRKVLPGARCVALARLRCSVGRELIGGARQALRAVRGTGAAVPGLLAIAVWLRSCEVLRGITIGPRGSRFRSV